MIAITIELIQGLSRSEKEVGVKSQQSIVNQRSVDKQLGSSIRNILGGTRD